MPVVSTTTTNYTFDENNDDQSNRKNMTNDVVVVKNDECNWLLKSFSYDFKFIYYALFRCFSDREN